MVAICVYFVVRDVDARISCSLFPGGFDPKDASFQEYKLVHAENVAKVRASEVQLHIMRTLRL